MDLINMYIQIKLATSRQYTSEDVFIFYRAKLSVMNYERQ